MSDDQTPLPCIFCNAAMERDYTGGVTYFQCANNHAIGLRLPPDDALILYNTVASNYAEAMKALPVHVAALARQDSLIGTLKRRIEKLEDQIKKSSPPPATPMYHRLNTEDSE